MFSCPNCKCAPLRMNGWVRAKKSTRSDWFCPKCREHWTHGRGDSERWILVWEDEFDWEDFHDQRVEGWKRVACPEPRSNFLL
eukprot:6351703-Amphidinium_carterae.1